ncbi:expressed unknown protein [Seminavis robusta]|uniref:Uncharacterized protein n=1 Tax=Seminavis robusta TaxID=568900 RepID=A0A9N8F190_9STRA|nr:expressed unknown protein [Seminavis robusta]|eukprot:Sro2983_g341570.1 n/a (181) ;mRNA; r:1027-1569
MGTSTIKAKTDFGIRTQNSHREPTLQREDVRRRQSQEWLVPIVDKWGANGMEHKRARPRETTSVAISDRRHSSRVSLPPTTIYTKALEAQETIPTKPKRRRGHLALSNATFQLPNVDPGGELSVLGLPDKHKRAMSNKVCKWLARWVRDNDVGPMEIVFSPGRRWKSWDSTGSLKKHEMI